MHESSQYDCPFCDVSKERIAFETPCSLAIWDGYPVTQGHLLIVPRRHVAVWRGLETHEVSDLGSAIEQAQRYLGDRFSIDGFNVGFNEGPAAGQTVPHFHVHIIPRRLGDMADPRGGVRHVIPEKGNYARAKPILPWESDGTPHKRALITGGEDALLQHLLPHIQHAQSVDVAVAFILDSGVRLLHPYFQELLDRGGRLRLIAGDYLDVTDPSSLRRLLDLDGDVHRWIFEAHLVSFHPKSWVFHFDQGGGIAIVGSSNLSETALRSGIEWNYRFYDATKGSGWQDVLDGFEALLERDEVKELTNDWIDRYEARRVRLDMPRREFAEAPPEPPLPAPIPHGIQLRAMDALRNSRRQGYTAGLVVLATGLGKTWLSAFDSESFDRILFVAHREEILSQAMATFRRLRPTARFGRYAGAEKDLQADVLFASIQTLGRISHLRNFPADAFDYIVVDEFHHAAARTYRTLIEHFTPKFLLGLTATPERTDGGDLLALCQENLVYRCDMFEGIEAELLSPFRYFGVPDEVDYSQIPWRSSAFDEQELTAALATQARAQNAFDQLRLRGGKRAIGFCCSRVHADFMAQYFVDRGVRAVAVHSGPTSAPRLSSLTSLQAGELDIVFAVDILNEGVDIPEIDTVLMLRPTESAIVWMQQFGRGLRVSQDKSHLIVLDYIGNHRIFLTKARALLQSGDGDRSLALALDRVRRHEMQFPPGCEVTYDLRALDLLEGLLRASRDADALEAFYVDFRSRHDQRPTATEVFHAGFNPRATGHGGWFSFVDHMGDLGTAGKTVHQRHGPFLDVVASTPMSKSYKMLLLEAMLQRDCLPGSMHIDALTAEVTRFAARNPRFKQDISVPLSDTDNVKRLLIANPIAAWIGGKGTGGETYFGFKEDLFHTMFEVAPVVRSTFVDMVREIIDWRLAHYLDRAPDEAVEKPERQKAEGDSNVLEPWQSYPRNEIPSFFEARFTPGSWNSGMVTVGQHLILLVTLTKGNLAAGNQYVDRFVDAQTFEWQSQDRTTQDSKHGQIINGSLPGHDVHLFVRSTKLRGAKAAPFTYCGVVAFQKWTGEKPITVTWKLSNPVPDHLRRLFDIGA